MAAIGSLFSMAGELGATAMVNKSNEEIARETNATNIQMTRETNAANVQSVQDTNATNLQIAQEANALSVQEAEKSYERSTATNQLAELMRAGFSAQQAKEIVAGSGSAPGYTPAPIQVPTMQAPQQVAPQVQPWTKQKPDMSALAGLGQGIFDSLADPNGGALGALIANDPAAEVFSHKGEDGFNIDDARTVADFEEYAKGHANDPEHWSQKLVNSKSWKMLKKTPAGMKGYAAYMTSYANTGTQFEGFKSSVQTAIQSAIKSRADQITLQIQEWNLPLEERKIELENGKIEILQQADIMRAKEVIASLGAKVDAMNKPEYRQYVAKQLLQDVKTQYVVQKALEQRTNATMNAFEQNELFYSIMQLMHDVGMTANDFGFAVAFAEANGVEVNAGLKQLVQNWKDYEGNAGFVNPENPNVSSSTGTIGFPHPITQHHPGGMY